MAQPVELNLGRAALRGIVKTTGTSPWLAPGLGFANPLITEILRQAGFEHGMDVGAGIRTLTGKDAEQSAEVSSKRSHSSPGSSLATGPEAASRLQQDWAEWIRQYNVGSYRGRSNIALGREGYALW